MDDPTPILPDTHTHKDTHTHTRTQRTGTMAEAGAGGKRRMTLRSGRAVLGDLSNRAGGAGLGQGGAGAGGGLLKKPAAASDRKSVV